MADGSGAIFDAKQDYRNDEQLKAKFYFSEGNKKGCSVSLIKGCFKKKKVKAPIAKAKGCFTKQALKFKFVSDAEYDALVKSIVDKLDPKTRALNKLNIDKSQVEKEISICNYRYFSYHTERPDGYDYKFGEDGLFRSTEYQISYIFCTQSQILAYQLSLSSDWNKHDESTFEYFYKDVTSFRSETEQQDEIKDGAVKYHTVSNEFKIVVPNDSFTVSLGNKPTQEEESAIQAMKAMLREKKG